MFSTGEGEPPIPIKIEISSRTTPDPASICVINGIQMYSISQIAHLKLLAAREDPAMPYRTTARDLHDLAFIASRYSADLPPELVAQLEEFFSDPTHLMERYASAYEGDPILNGRLFDDLSIIEEWLDHQNDEDTLSMFGPC